MLQLFKLLRIQQLGAKHDPMMQNMEIENMLDIKIRPLMAKERLLTALGRLASETSKIVTVSPTITINNKISGRRRQY